MRKRENGKLTSIFVLCWPEKVSNFSWLLSMTLIHVCTRRHRHRHTHNQTSWCKVVKSILRTIYISITLECNAYILITDERYDSKEHSINFVNIPILSLTLDALTHTHFVCGNNIFWLRAHTTTHFRMAASITTRPQHCSSQVSETEKNKKEEKFAREANNFTQLKRQVSCVNLPH